MQPMFKLLHPKLLQIKNSIIHRRKSYLSKTVIMTVFGLLFWGGIFLIFYRVLHYFQTIPGFGDFLASKLLSMVLLTLFCIHLFSAIITSISCLFMSEELNIVLASPYDKEHIFSSKLVEILCHSSWMVILFSMPVFLSYGILYGMDIYYYLVLLTLFIAMLIISSTIAMGISIFLVKFFPARRIKDILFLLSLFFVIAIYLLFRFLQPERLVDPDAFFSVFDYLAALNTPSSPFIPSQWATDILSSILFDGSYNIGFSFLLLWSTALAFIVILNYIFTTQFAHTWSKSQEASNTKVTSKAFAETLLHVCLLPFGRTARAVLEKEIKTFFRDTTQWSQLFILAAIVVVYIYNIKVIPIDNSPLPTIYLQNVLSFINLGLAAFVVAAVAVRFAFPALSMEGECFWIIKSSPVSVKKLLWHKYAMNVIFLSVLAQVIILLSNYFLRVDTFMIWLSCISMFLMTFGITAIAVGCGAIYPKFRHENPAQIASGFGGLLCMILSVVFIGTVVVLQARPVYIILMSGFRGVPLSGLDITQIAASFTVVIIVNILAFILPMKIALKKLSQLETF